MSSLRQQISPSVFSEQFPGLVNARKCVEMALVSLAALVSDDDLDRTREILSRFGFADIL